MRTTNRHLLLFLIFILPFFAGGYSSATGQEYTGQAWQVGARRWTTQEEQRFAQWVEQTVTEDFFLRYNIAVDCADVPYAVRWIYARIAHLPAAVTTPEGTLLGHWSTAWQHLSTAREWYRDRRFLASLQEILEQTSTKTLQKDTYPIRIEAQSLAAGAAFLHDGHSGIVGRIVTDGSTYSPVQTWQATLPRKITKLRQRNYFGTDVDIERGTGLVRFRWPVLIGTRWQYLAIEKHPYYSLQQYSPDFSRIGESLDDAVARRIAPGQRDPARRVRLITDSIYHYLLDRVKLVQAGFAHCSRNSCPEGSTSWEIYSTPARDEMIGLEIYHLQRLIKDNGLDEKKLAREMAERAIPIGGNQTVTLQYIVDNYPWMSHDPNAPIAARWGLAKCEMIAEKIRNALVDLDFAEQRYRTTDPEYADRLRQKNTYIIKSLYEEERKSSCLDFPSAPAKSAPRPPPLPILSP